MKGNIVKNNLGFDTNLVIYQDKNMFNYSVDTIMLGNFVTINSNVNKILDIGCNNGALSIFVAARKKTLDIDAIEILTHSYNLCLKNVELNNMQDQIHPINNDFNHFYVNHAKVQKQKYDLIMVNPPFYKIGHTKNRKVNSEILIARTELKLTLDNIIKGASKIIKQKGYLSMVHKPERLVDILVLLRKYHFEPKRIQFIHPRPQHKAILVLIESRFHAGWGQHFLPNIYLHVDDKNKHEYNEKTKKLYKPIMEKE